MSSSAPHAPGRQFAGGGALGELIRARDWSTTPLGPAASWPQELTTLLAVVLASEQPMFVAWGEQRVVLYNDGYAQVLGERHPQALGRPFLEVWHDIAGDLRPLMRRTAAGEAIYMDDILLQMQRGGRSEETHFAFSWTPVRLADGSIGGVFCVCSETSHQVLEDRALRRAEAELRERFLHDMLRLHRLFEQAPGLIAVLRGPQHVFELANHAYQRLVGGRELIGLPVREALPEVIGQGFVELLDQVYRTGSSFSGHDSRVLLRRRPGDPPEESFIDFIYQPIVDDRGAVEGIFVEGYDVTERRRAVDLLRDTSERLRLIVESAVDFAIITTDLEGRVTLWSPGAERLTGWSAEEMLGSRADRFFTPEDREDDRAQKEMALAAENGRASNERWHLRCDGSRFWASGLMMPLKDQAGAVVGYLKIMRDRTDERETEEQLERRVAERTEELAAANRELVAQIEEREQAQASLRQLQRLEAVGQLTAGVAHDFNNLLQVIVGNIGILRRLFEQTNAEEKYRQRLDSMATAADRGAKLTAQLLAFSRRQRLEPKPTDLNETVEGMVDLLRSSIGGTVRLEMRLQAGLWNALVDPTQIELVILNLALNARDAMEVGGKLGIATRNGRVTTRPERPEEPVAGEYVVLAVSDTGTGMSEEVRRRVFEPFFTTKELGKGSGLGLSQVLGFAQQSGGGVRLQSVPGEGTTVEVYLPRADSSPAAVHVPARLANATRDAEDQPQCILLVDDDDPVREVTAAMLEAEGYEVLEAGSGGAALERLATAGDRVDLLVVDFAMPGMNGVEVAREAVARHPGLPVLFITGFADHRKLRVNERQVIDKPFAAEDLLAAVRAALQPGHGTMH